MKKEITWTTKEGKVMLIDDMTEQHAKNALKMMVRRFEEIRKIIKEEIINKQKVKPKFKIHGDIAQDHIDQGYLQEQEDYGYDNEYFEL